MENFRGQFDIWTSLEVDSLRKFRGLMIILRNVYIGRSAGWALTLLVLREYDVWASLGLCCKWTYERTKLSLLVFIDVGLKFFGNLMDCI